MAAQDGAVEPQPNATVYVRGLNERLKIPRLRELLTETFSEYGTIVDIVAKKNLKAKGQAFIVFDNVDSAREVIEDLQGFDLDGFPMTLAFAKTRSDATVAREDGEAGLETHKRRRVAEKERKQALAAQAANSKRAAAETSVVPSRPAKVAKPTPGTGAAADSSVIPDEFLPPNRILFLRELPAGTTKETLATIFGRFNGFKEVRTVPGRAGIAFVEYEEEEGAIAAKESTAGMVIGGEDGKEGKGIRVTFQRK